MTTLFKAILTEPIIVRAVLKHATNFEGWSLQGFGMLRLYLSKEVRIHVWDNRYAVPEVSLLHDHPWDFESFIVCGQMTNYRYEIYDQNNPIHQGLPASIMECSKIQCGPGGGIRSTPEICTLVETSVERMRGRTLYKQRADEIHKSVPTNGTVSVVDRTFRPDTEHARVFWPAGYQWVSAEPRPATREEILDITGYALDNWE